MLASWYSIQATVYSSLSLGAASWTSHLWSSQCWLKGQKDTTAVLPQRVMPACAVSQMQHAQIAEHAPLLLLVASVSNKGCQFASNLQALLSASEHACTLAALHKVNVHNIYGCQDRSCTCWRGRFALCPYQGLAALR